MTANEEHLSCLSSEGDRLGKQFIHGRRKTGSILRREERISGHESYTHTYMGGFQVPISLVLS